MSQIELHLALNMRDMRFAEQMLMHTCAADMLQELPSSGVSFERELDEVVPVLLKKAGDLSTAGGHSHTLLFHAVENP
jgi:hypothetical protein